MPVITALRFGFTIMLIVMFVYGVYESRTFSAQGSIFPLFITSAGLVLATTTFVIDVVRWRRQGTAVGGDAPSTASTAAYEPGAPIGYVFTRAARYGLWMMGYLLLIWLIGLPAAGAVFVTIFLLVEANIGLRYVWLAPVFVLAVLLTLANMMNLSWPNALFPLIE